MHAMLTPDSPKTGFAGKLAATFIRSKLTVVITLVSLGVGLLAVWLTPKEEEPQISVPMIDIEVPAPGLEPAEVQRNITEPIERAVWGLDGVEYVYSVSQPHGALITVRFRVGEPMEPSLVKVHHKMMTFRQSLPLGGLAYQVKSYSIDDVPFLTLSFSSPQKDDFSLRLLVAPLARELSSTPDLSRVEILGGRKRAIRVIANQDKMAKWGVSLLAVAQALQANHAYAPAGKNWGEAKVFDVEVGGRLKRVQDVQAIAVGQSGGRIVRIADIGTVEDGPEERVRISRLHEKNLPPAEAVSIVFAKRKGTNVVRLAKNILERAHEYQKSLPEDVHLSVVRNYGSTAEDKSKELMEHLFLATLSVSVLIAIFMGIRAALVVAIAIPVTLSTTLAIYYFMGYTLNRVTLFALIFSIGILVDDAIVVVENIERHLRQRPQKSEFFRTVIRAVSEVGNPTILATWTVIAAILPMAFVRGLMGPYMRPIPVGASLAMILSLLVAFVVTPWASAHLLPHKAQRDQNTPQESILDRLYRRVMDFLLGKKAHSVYFGILIGVLFLGAIGFFYFKWVKVKMLPFDNKNEFQVLLDYPVTTPLQTSVRNADTLARQLLEHPEVRSVQVFSGESAPFSFSGMVKHSFLRQGEWMSDLHVLLTDKDERKLSSHEIIYALRDPIAKHAHEFEALSKVLEIPPGPPVLATLMAEVYGPTHEERRAAAMAVEKVFHAEESVVDLDVTWRPQRPRLVYEYNQHKGGGVGARSQEVAHLGRLLFSETPFGFLEDPGSPEPVAIDLSVAQKTRSGLRPFRDQFIPTWQSGIYSVEGVLSPPTTQESQHLFRKNLMPVEYVMAELAGAEEAPVYGILKLAPKIPFTQQTANVPWNTRGVVVKWDGEWFITYEVFRDLGAAFAVVMILIYILIVGWFRSFWVPLVIMLPIPISLIGIIPGHAILGAFFTATSMIGFIAGAGVIVRNSIILVDFTEHQIRDRGLALKEAVISAGVLRFRPMLLTAAAVVVGTSVMLFDPIFQGLAISMMAGEVAATLLSRFAVPILYFWLLGEKRVKELQPIS